MRLTRAAAVGTPAASALVVAFVVVLLGGAIAACSTTYQPVALAHACPSANAQIRIIIHNGAAMYVKDGQEFPIGPLGGALEPLVASVPPAAARAHRARHQLAVGVPLYVGGVAALVLRLVAFRGTPGWIALGAGVPATVTGLSLIGAGFTNAVDAVNIYNDWPGPAPRAPP